MDVSQSYVHELKMGDFSMTEKLHIYALRQDGGPSGALLEMARSWEHRYCLLRFQRIWPTLQSVNLRGTIQGHRRGCFRFFLERWEDIRNPGEEELKLNPTFQSQR
nr:hypothetical protein Iba_chr03aCG19360 [Ipomoea batatas]